MGGGRYGPGGGPIPHRGPDAMGPQAASTSGGYYSYGNPPGIPPDARPFYIGYYIPGGGQADMSGQGQGRGRGDNRRMSGPPVFFSQGPPPQGMMGPPPQNMQHSPPTHIMHQQQNQPQGQYQQYPPQQYPPGMMGGGHVMSQGPQPAASSGLQLVVHNLPWSCTWQQLKEHFDDYKAERAEVVLDSFGRSRGFGIVRFLTPQDAEAACEALNNSSIEGRVISVRPDRYA